MSSKLELSTQKGSGYWGKVKTIQAHLTSPRELLGIDPRSLVLFRVALALLVFNDLSTRAIDLTVFYTDQGALPRAVLLGVKSNPFAISVHLMSGTVFAQRSLFLLEALCALGLLLGLWTRWMTFGCWFLTISLQDRNPLIAMGGADTYLRLLLFWSLFLPLGKYFSLDAATESVRENVRRRIFGWGTAAILLQCTIVYLMTAALKWRTELWQQGMAVQQVLSNDIYAKPVAELLLRFPAMVRFLNGAVLGFETLGPALLFFPFFTGPVRTLAVFGFLFMHLCFYLCLNIYSFQMISAAAMLLFLPSWFWDKLASRHSRMAA